jgi:predicted transcriptional regulator
VKSQRSLLDVLFPAVRAELLRLLFTAPQKQRYVRELTSMSGLALCTVQDELRKLAAVSVLTSWSNGYHRFYRANRDHPLFSELCRIVEMSARFPPTKHSALRRRAQSPKHSNRGRRSRRALPADQPIRWDLFSSGQKT